LNLGTRKGALVFEFLRLIVFAVLITAVINVLFKRITLKEHKQIGICKALGLTRAQVTLIYVMQAALVAIIGVALGGVFTMLMTNPVISAMSFMFIIPTMGFDFYPVIWGIVLMSWYQPDRRKHDIHKRTDLSDDRVRLAVGCGRFIFGWFD